MKREKIYAGNSKNLYTSGEEYTLILSFHDGIQIGKNKINISGKSALCNSISSLLMERLDMVGIENHFLNKNNAYEQLVQFADAYPVQAIISNIATRRYAMNFGIEEGTVFDSPVIDFRVKNSELGYPSINEHQILNFGWMNKVEIKELKRQSIRVNDFLTGLFSACGIRLVEAKLEFGRLYNGEDFLVMLIDELSPDNLKLWDMSSNSKMSHELLYEDNFSWAQNELTIVDSGDIKPGDKLVVCPDDSSSLDIICSYREVAKRLGVLPI